LRPTREHATKGGQTYVVTTKSWGGLSLVRDKRCVRQLILVCGYLLFSHSVFGTTVVKELGSNLEVWQKGFPDHRICDASDYATHRVYVRQNPVRKGLSERAEDYPYSSAHGGFELDNEPQGLKPVALGTVAGAP
jgi:hypothetical protein